MRRSLQAHRPRIGGAARVAPIMCRASGSSVRAYVRAFAGLPVVLGTRPWPGTCFANQRGPSQSRRLCPHGCRAERERDRLGEWPR